MSANGPLDGAHSRGFGDESPALQLPAAAQTGLVARFKSRLFPVPVVGSSARLPAIVPARKPGLQASIAEFLLVSRLKARTLARRETSQAAGMLERAAHIIFVTCKHWFTSPEQRPRRHDTRL